MTISITMEQSQRECDKSDFIDFLGGKSFLEGTGPTKLLNDDDRRVERWLRGYLNKEWENDSTTFESFCVVSKKSSKAIIDAFKKRLSKDRDARNYQATLGELRAFADLLRLGYFTTDYRGEKQAGCDFLVCKSENGEEVFQIEVFTMQDRPNCKSDLSPNVTEVCPFGIPTKDSNVTLEMVCKLHGIKERTRQVGTTSPALLYIDFQSMFPFGSSIVEHCAPMLEWNGTFTSGGIWLSFYGMKGQKVLENVSRAERLSCPDLPFLGLFSQKKTSPFAGAILSFPRGNKTAGGRLVYFENPFADHLLNPIARDMLLKHPDCNLQYSLWSTSHFNLIDYVSQQNNRSDVLFAELDKGFDVFT